MDTRQRRRDAEKAARQLIADRTALIGELAVAQSEREAAQAFMDDARERGRQLVREAEEHAAALLTKVREEADTVDVTYADRHADAVTGGWSRPDLAQLGFSAPARRSRPRPAAATDTVATPATRDGTATGSASSAGSEPIDGHQNGELTTALP